MNFQNLQQTKQYVIDSEQTANNYSHEKSIKFLTNSIERSLYNYSDSYILVTGNIQLLKMLIMENLLQLQKQHLKIVDHLKISEQKSMIVDEADFINITMPMNNVIEYSDNYSDTSVSLWQIKGD